MKFKTKLYFGLGFNLILFFIFLVILIRMVNQQTINMNQVITDLDERKKFTTTIQTEISNMGREISEISSVSIKDVLPQTLNEWEKSRLTIHSSIETLEKLDNRKETQELLSKFNTLFKAYEDIGEQIIFIQKNNKNESLDKNLLDNSKYNRERLKQITDLLFTLQEQEMKDQLSRTHEDYHFALNVIYGYAFFSLLFMVGSALWSIKGLTRNLNRVTTVMSNVASHHDYGTNFPRIEVASKDEIGAITIAYNKMAQVLENQAKHEKALMEKAEEQSWLKSKIAEIGSIFTSVEDFNTLASLFINKITPMVGAQYGVLYIKQETEVKQRFENMGSYASLSDQTTIKSFRLGEGLIGQCAAEKKPIMLSKIPEDSLKISIGSGLVSPKSMYILPAEYEGEVLAVLELAAIEPFTIIQRELLTEVMNNIGITIHSIGNRMKVKKLLQESQTLTEELQSQSEELQLQQEELRAINEELEAQYKNSEQKKAELERISIMLEEKAQELALTSQYKTEFLANMSHELRTPLNSMLILAQMLIEKKNDNLSGKQLDYIKTIFSSGNDLLHLINEVLDLAKVEAGKIEVIASWVQLEKIRSFVNRYFTPLARQKGIEFYLNFEGKLPNAIYTDEHRLNQILRNLLSNAYKFTENGSISLTVQSVARRELGDLVSREHVDSMVCFTVTDTGIGIPKEKQQQIFDAFVQADGTTSRKYGGTGLGLSISRDLAQLLGGFIEVISEEGVGSSFKLFLPVNQQLETEGTVPVLLEAAAAVEEKGSLTSEWRIATSDLNQTIKTEIPLINGKRILIVDDDMRNIFALSAALEEYEIDVLFAENGREGIEILQKNPEIDLIMMDIMMPEMDGFEAMRKIRSIPDFQDLPIIALTAKAMKHNREQCIEAGASDYISKPIDLDQLYSLIQVWLYR